MPVVQDPINFDRPQDLERFVEDFNEQSSIDLVQASINEAYFLSYVNESERFLFEENVLENAIRRYETCWLPMQAKNPNLELIPPLDVHFIWHCHMLRPLSYRKDCISIVGTVVDHKVFSNEKLNDNEIRNCAKKTWQEFIPIEPYDFDSQNYAVSGQYEQQSSYDLKSAVHRQQTFIKKISAKTMGLMPTLDMDLVWHTHQLHPRLYANDCLKMFGYIINHNDTVEKKTEKQRITQNWWMKLQLGEYKITTNAACCSECQNKETIDAACCSECQNKETIDAACCSECQNKDTVDAACCSECENKDAIDA
uniref:Uncharacterized protein n=1 Tax=Acrobeloides nanus TaxID=290746 RepID=A0A914CSV5_9BILA